MVDPVTLTGRASLVRRLHPHRNLVRLLPDLPDLLDLPDLPDRPAHKAHQARKVQWDQQDLEDPQDPQAPLDNKVPQELPEQPDQLNQLIKENCKNLIPCGIRNTKIKYELSHYTGYRPMGQDGRYFCIWIAVLRDNLARSGKGELQIPMGLD